MPWPCFIVKDISEAKEPGAMWPVNDVTSGKTNWLVKLPNGGVHNIHGKSSDGTYWDVTGEAPNFTVSPSIDYRGAGNDAPVWAMKGWHGYLTNGVLTDDYDGRTY